MAISGKMTLKKKGQSWNGVIVPTDNPMGWFIQPFPNEEVGLAFAKQFNLDVTIEEDEESAPNDDNQQKRK